ncbi:hypothetical protein BZA77DRAFT_297544 [Pyronema omphalodes]|nr:hypothetical protein BZA77DRAFT_297544 [Pyronema omphalodes]
MASITAIPQTSYEPKTPSRMPITTTYIPDPKARRQVPTKKKARKNTTKKSKPQKKHKIIKDQRGRPSILNRVPPHNIVRKIPQTPLPREYHYRTRLSRRPNLEPDFERLVVNGDEEVLDCYNNLLEKEYPICNVYRSVPITWGSSKLQNPGYWRFRYQKSLFQRETNWRTSETARDAWDEMEEECSWNIVVRSGGEKSFEKWDGMEKMMKKMVLMITKVHWCFLSSSKFKNTSRY